MLVSIIGAGGFGTALAQSISRKVREVRLFARRQAVLDDILKDRRNKSYFPSITLNENIKPCSMRETVLLRESDTVFLAVPSGSTRELVINLRDHLADKTIVSVAKGIDIPSLSTMSEVIRAEICSDRVVVFSGPTFADEIVLGTMVGVTMGAKEKDIADGVVEVMPDNFHFDYSSDMRGIELCGVLKNIYANAVGIWDSFHDSSNEHYLFLNLCYKEMGRVLNKLSDDTELSTKFCGFGDFSLTSNVDKSRNRTLGLMLGKKMIVPSLVNTSIVMEGMKSAKGMKDICRRNQIDVPIIDFIEKVLTKDVNLISEMYELLNSISRCSNHGPGVNSIAIEAQRE